jgi:hypothetical protein
MTVLPVTKCKSETYTLDFGWIYKTSSFIRTFFSLHLDIVTPMTIKRTKTINNLNGKLLINSIMKMSFFILFIVN